MLYIIIYYIFNILSSKLAQCTVNNNLHGTLSLFFPNDHHESGDWQW